VRDTDDKGENMYRFVCVSVGIIPTHSFFLLSDILCCSFVTLMFLDVL